MLGYQLLIIIKNYEKGDIMPKYKKKNRKSRHYNLTHPYKEKALCYTSLMQYLHRYQVSTLLSRRNGDIRASFLINHKDWFFKVSSYTAFQIYNIAKSEYGDIRLKNLYENDELLRNRGFSENHIYLLATMSRKLSHRLLSTLPKYYDELSKADFSFDQIKRLLNNSVNFLPIENIYEHLDMLKDQLDLTCEEITQIGESSQYNREFWRRIDSASSVKGIKNSFLKPTVSSSQAHFSYSLSGATFFESSLASLRGSDSQRDTCSEVLSHTSDKVSNNDDIDQLSDFQDFDPECTSRQSFGCSRDSIEGIPEDIEDNLASHQGISAYNPLIFDQIAERAISDLSKEEEYNEQYGEGAFDEFYSSYTLN